MEHIALAPDPILTVLSIVLPFAATGIYILSARTRREGLKISLMALGLATLYGWVAALSFSAAVPQDRQRDEFRAQAEELYGIELSSEDALELRYPLSEPRADFKVLGEIAADLPTAAGFERKAAIFLIWKDGRLMLAGSPDGETFTELQR